MIKMTTPDGKVTTKTYSADGLHRAQQVFGQAPITYIWGGSDYLGQI